MTLITYLVIYQMVGEFLMRQFFDLSDGRRVSYGTVFQKRFLINSESLSCKLVVLSDPGGLWGRALHGSTLVPKSQTWLSDWTKLNWTEFSQCLIQGLQLPARWLVLKLLLSVLLLWLIQRKTLTSVSPE